MKTLLLSFLVCLSLSVTAQTTNDIVGDWQFYTIKTPPGTKKSQFDGASSIINGMTMQLNADKSYSLSLMGMVEKGEWELKDKEILFNVSTGNSYSMRLSDYEKNLITINKEKFVVVLSRKGANIPPPPAFKEEKIYTKANMAQLSKKWFLKQCPAPANMTDKQKEAFGKMLSGSYMELQPNGKCTMQLGEKKENAQWQLNQAGNGIMTTFKNMPKEINFTKVTVSDLVGDDTITGEEWVFSTIE